MRLIGSFPTEALARRFSYYLKKENIDNTYEVQMQTKTEQFSFEVWVHNEDQLQSATQFYQEFQKDPANKKFDVSLEELVDTQEPAEEDQEDKDLAKLQRVVPSQSTNRPVVYALTGFFFIVCVILYFFTLMQESALKQKNQTYLGYRFTPIQLMLIYDVPPELLQLYQTLDKYDIDPKKPIEEQPEGVKSAIMNFNQLPLGFYDSIVLKLKNPKSSWQSPIEMFLKIKQGEVWRLWTPIFLHGGFLHILFNMIWLWVLGKQIEERLSRGKYLLLVIIIALLSNTAQYLMSGPFFLGFSGVIMGMVGFIWSRQKVAPWEGYPLQRMILIFLLFYILAILALQVYSFFIEIYGAPLFKQVIANTAHISGAIIGAILGRFSFFSWRPLER